jgi:parvulin-like peptidyl-prolyl isomerase
MRLSSAAEFEKSVLRDRGTTLFEYREDVIKPGILMRKLVEKRVKVDDEDVKRAFEANYGEKVQCRILVVPRDNGLQNAIRLHEQVRGKGLQEFITLAAKNANPQLAATGGQIRPINRHSALGNVETEAFRLKDGEVSTILDTPEGYVILFRERLIPADTTIKFDAVRESLHKEIRKKKIEREIPTMFNEMKFSASVRDYLNNRFDIKGVQKELQNPMAEK